MLAFKLIIFCLNFFISSSHSSPANIESLIGTWQLKSFSCEDLSLPGTDQPQNPFESLASLPTKTFAADLSFSDKVIIPLGSKSQCETFGLGSFSIKDNVLDIKINALDSPDCPGLVKSFNENLKDNNLFSYEFKFFDKNTLLLFQSLTAGETDFRCGKSNRVVETWIKL